MISTGNSMSAVISICDSMMPEVVTYNAVIRTCNSMSAVISIAPA